MRFVFDLDGTLVETLTAVRAAYLAAGVVVPETAYNQPVGDWCTPAQHDAKNNVYRLMLLRYGKPNMLLYLYAWQTRSPVLTGASQRAVELVQELYGPLNVELVGATLDQKIAWLNAQSEPGTYVDDDPVARERVQQETRWNSISPGEFPRSSSPPVPTPVSKA